MLELGSLHVQQRPDELNEESLAVSFPDTVPSVEVVDLLFFPLFEFHQYEVCWLHVLPDSRNIFAAEHQDSHTAEIKSLKLLYSYSLSPARPLFIFEVNHKPIVGLFLHVNSKEQRSAFVLENFA